MRVLIGLLLACTLLSSCATQPHAPPDSGQTLDLFAYFENGADAWGIFTPRFGGSARSFEVSIDSTIEDRQLVLDERFVFDDGEKDRRVWRITEVSPGRYIGEADDVVGPATGEASGDRLVWRYTLQLTPRLRVSLDDRMYLQEDGVLFNRAVVRKYGVRVGDITISFKPRPPKNLATP